MKLFLVVVSLYYILFLPTLANYINKNPVIDTFIFGKSKCFNVSIILIPGFGGSQLKYRSVSYYGKHKIVGFWHNLWLDPMKLYFTRFMRYFKMYYNSKTNKVFNYDDIEIDVLDFKSPSTVEYLTPFYEYVLKYWSYYYHYIINELTSNHCFTEGYDLFAAAYDFRYITYKPKMVHYFDDLTKLVQTVYKQTGKKIVLISHSLGGTITNKFLNTKSSIWKQKYIQGWNSINGVFAPDIVALASVTVGYNPGIPYVLSLKTLKLISASLITFYSIMPSPKNSPLDKVIAYVDGVEFKVKDLYYLFNLTNVPYGKELVELSENIFECYQDDIFINFIYSNGYDTRDKLVMTKQSDNTYVEQNDKFVDGDQTVTFKSLTSFSRCEKSDMNHQHKKTTTKLIQNLDHMNVLYDAKVIKNIIQFIRHIHNK